MSSNYFQNVCTPSLNENIHQFRQKLYVPGFASMFSHLPLSIGNLWFNVLNLQNSYTKLWLSTVVRAVCRFLERGCGGGSGRGLWISVPTGRSRISGYRGCIEKVSPSEARRQNVWGISWEKSRFYAKNHIFFPILGGATGDPPPPWIRHWFR